MAIDGTWIINSRKAFKGGGNPVIGQGDTWTVTKISDTNWRLTWKKNGTSHTNKTITYPGNHGFIFHDKTADASIRAWQITNNVMLGVVTKHHDVDDPTSYGDPVHDNDVDLFVALRSGSTTFQ